VVAVSKGWLKASHREVDEAKSRPGQPFHTHTDPVPIEPDKVYRYDIEIWPLCRTFKKGHRLRLRIASGDSPVWDVMNYHNTIFQPGRNTVYHNKEYSSHLILPVIPESQSLTELRPDIDYKPPVPVS
jgi:predicted acyl esterase